MSERQISAPISEPILEVITNDKNYLIDTKNVNSVGNLVRKYLEHSKLKEIQNSITNPGKLQIFRDYFNIIYNDKGEICCFLNLKMNGQSNMEEVIKANENVVLLLEENKTLLHIAAKKGRLSAVKYLANYMDINEATPNGLTPFMRAAECNKVKIMKHLKKKGDDRGEPIDVESKNHKGNRALHKAANHGRTEAIKLLLSYNADVNARNDNGSTPLHCAASNGSSDAIEVLLNAKAEINAKDKKKGKTPLVTAITEGHLEATQILLKRGADINIASINGFTALFWAVCKKEEKIVKFLLDNYIDHIKLNQTDGNRDTVLDVANYMQLENIQKVLKQHGALVGKQDEKIYPIHDAVSDKDVEKLKSLLQTGHHSVLRKNKDGQTPLHIAAVLGWKEGIECLIKAKADVNAFDSHHSTPVHLATSNGQHLDVIELLLISGAPKANFKLTNGSDQNLLHLSAIHGRDDIFEIIIKRGERFNKKDALGSTPLMYAAEKGCLKIVELLLGERNVDLSAKNNNEEDALMIASRNKNRDVITLLTTAMNNASVCSNK